MSSPSPDDTGTGDDLHTQDIEGRIKLVKNKRKSIRGKITRTIHRVQEAIAQENVSRRRLLKELEELRTDYTKVCEIHAELYTCVDETQVARLDQWEADVINDIYTFEEEAEDYLLSLSENGEEDLSHSKSQKQKTTKSNHANKSHHSTPSGSGSNAEQNSSADGHSGDTGQINKILQTHPQIHRISHNLTPLEASKDIPTVTLGKFDGNPLEYVNFIEKFKIHIHNKPHLSDDRMMQLRMHVSGDAERAISGLGSSGTMCATAVKILQDQFGQDIDFPHKAGPIDLILGVHYSHLHAEEEVRQGLPFEPIGKRTKLGWYAMGPDKTQRLSSICSVNFVDKVNLEKFYDFETLGIQAPNCDCPTEVMSGEDRKALELMQSSCVKQGDRYEIGLPWERDPSSLPNNYFLAEKRLCSLERSLQKDDAKAKMYNDAIHEYEQNAWAEKVDMSKSHCDQGPVYYLPHHGVYRPDKPSTPLRVVLDPACQYQGVSLNSYLYKGPGLIGKLLGVLLRFREEPVAIVGDISKMYLQIKLKDSDTHVHRFLWRDIETATCPTVYRLLRVTFGDKPSPDMASYVVLLMADQHKEDYPDASNVLKRDRYMDDLIHSCETSDEALKRMHDLDRILATGQFQIKEWYCSLEEVRKQLALEKRGKLNETDISLDGEEVKTLGLGWNPVMDTMSFVVRDVSTEKYTKRIVLSKMSMLYDPLGLAAAVTIKAKMAMQDVWRHKSLDWDDPLPDEMCELWQGLFAEMKRLEHVEFVRCLKPCDSVGSSELHVFGDASMGAYGAAAYLLWPTVRGTEVQLVFAKARVAPLHQTTIPRWELMAALVATRLAKTICIEFKEKPSDVTLWTDSRIVLHWIHSDSISFKAFVGVRIAEIQSVWDASHWKYVPTALNPADDLSRGISVEEINGRWVHGPSFLKLPTEQWPIQPTDEVVVKDSSEMRKSKLVASCIPVLPVIEAENVSSWQHLFEGYSPYCLRFIQRLRDKVRKSNSRLSLKYLCSVMKHLQLNCSG
ncbi:uncharacterized protein LOC124275051 [Haliotis rubra]|uniref:uncharacterized protein LOC124275051 n=1 Tax=Haliotis rubra TaxID=36100 RepID=UPI001EE5A361|nr:uncharacterized protein LOC124275051 [Haliotis rubra]